MRQNSFSNLERFKFDQDSLAPKSLYRRDWDDDDICQVCTYIEGVDNEGKTI